MILVSVDVSGTGLRPAASGKRGQFGGLASLAGIDLKPDDRTAEAMALLESRQFTESFLTERPPAALVLFASRWDVEEKRWRSVSEKYQRLTTVCAFHPQGAASSPGYEDRA